MVKANMAEILTLTGFSSLMECSQPAEQAVSLIQG